MSSIPNAAWGLLSVVAICTTVSYTKWKANQEETRLFFKLDQAFAKLLESIDQEKQKTDEHLRRIDDTLEKIQNWKNY